MADIAYERGFYEALDRVANFINSLDSSEMSPREVRSAIYSECLEMRPRTHRENSNHAQG